MQVKVFVVMLVAGTMRVASAQPAESYPVTVVDRPIVLLPGMTTLDISLDLPTYVRTSTDAMGNTTTTRTPLGQHHFPDVNVTHAFGPMEINAGVLLPADFDAAHVGATMAVTEDSSVGISLGYYDNGINATDREFGQSAGYGYRFVRVPSRFAAFATVGIDVSEIKLTPLMGPPSSGHYIAPYGSLAGELQLASNVALAERVALEVPISTLNASSATSLAEMTTLLVSFGHWDLYAQFAMSNLIHMPHPFVGVGFVHRWF